MGRIIHVELTATDVRRSAAFYAEVFGWQTTPSPFVGDYLTADTGKGDGIDGAIMTRAYQEQPVIFWLEVDDLEQSLADVRAAGGAADSEPQGIPGVGRVAYVRDPEGTLLGLRQPV
jgi:predicted enzyme related to lactoylglutathione lyase